MAAVDGPRARLGRLERPALTGVLVREVVNFSSYWKSTHVLLDGRADDLPARLRLRLRLARQHDRRLRRTSSSSGPARWRRPCSSRAPSRPCSGRSSSTSSSARTTRSSPRPSTPRSSSPPRRSGSRRAPACTAACRCSSRCCSGSTRRGGCSSCPFIAWISGFGWACFGITIAGFSKSFENFNYVVSAVLTPLFLAGRDVLPARRGSSMGAVAGPLQPAPPLRRARPRRRLRLGRAGTTCSGWRR